MEKEKIKDHEMKNVGGGWKGEYRYIDCYCCPSCGTVNTIGRYCTSGESTWNCEKCGSCFTINF